MARPKNDTRLDVPIKGLQFAKCRILEDGRVEGWLGDHPDEKNALKEMLCRTTQQEACRYLFNDLCPEAMAAVSTDDADDEDPEVEDD